MNSKKEVQHVYLVGAKSLGAYMEWHIRLVLEGEDRLVRNLEARESETFSYAADVNPEYNNEMEDPRINVMEKRGIETFLGNLNRDIRAANSLIPL